VRAYGRERAAPNGGGRGRGEINSLNEFEPLPCSRHRATIVTATIVAAVVVAATIVAAVVVAAIVAAAAVAVAVVGIGGSGGLLRRLLPNGAVVVALFEGQKTDRHHQRGHRDLHADIAPVQQGGGRNGAGETGGETSGVSAAREAATHAAIFRPEPPGKAATPPPPLAHAAWQPGTRSRMEPPEPTRLEEDDQPSLGGHTGEVGLLR